MSLPWSGLLGMVLLLAGVTAPLADSARTITWKDLVPEAQVESPFAKLTKAQRLALSDIAETRDRKDKGEALNAIELEDERAATRKLEQSGIEVDGLLRLRREMMEQKGAQSRAVNPALDGQWVRIPGYLLPVEFRGKEVSEFLLVPWVGACIHTPPPPPNQIVHVKPDKPYASAGLFAPVWVTGRMATAAMKRSLHLVDGNANVEASYALKAALVEPYKEEAR